MNKKNSLSIYTNPAGLEHNTGASHPETAKRQEEVLSLLDAPEFENIPLIKCEDFTQENALRVHTQNYIDQLEMMIPAFGETILEDDIILSPESLNAALSAANACCQAIDDIAEEKTRRAFCAVRPPGHHATPKKPMGFCLLNNVIIAARHAQEKHNIKKIAIIDFDVHHGNGTQDFAKNLQGILFCSSHQSPLYPHTGKIEDNISGKIINAPLKENSGTKELQETYRKIIFPAVKNFQPDLIIISAGFDAHKNDPLANLNFTDEDYKWLTSKICEIAEEFCAGKVLSVLEGGYHLKALKNATREHLHALNM